ncbi:hypothetical protein [Streptomyces sp. NPDC093149]|uniref:hypothetical protein n=1 Tax=Streptomyces sp. NPDC093149 TaxID=3366031 RepID=UPI0038183436
MNDVRELLGRVAEEAGRPVISTQAVYAGAARVRLRRRLTVSAAALAVVAAGAAAVPGLASGENKQDAPVAAPAELTGGDGRAQRLAELLPEGVGKVERVSLAVIIKGATPEQARDHLDGPLDGQYSVRRDGGVGYLVIGFLDGRKAGRKFGGQDPAADVCRPVNGEPRPDDCVREELPGGRVLTTWKDPMNYSGTPKWGPEFVGRLTLKDGGVLAVRDSTGFTSERAQGPLLKSPPLTRAQLRSLLLSQELLPKKG